MTHPQDDNQESNSRGPWHIGQALGGDAAPSTTPVVLHVRVVTAAGGGPDKTILRSAKFARAGKFSVAAAYIHQRDDRGIDILRDTAERFSCPFYAIPERGAVDFSVVGKLLELCRSLGVTIWHGHDYKSDVLGLILKRLRPMKLITTAHGFTRETARTRFYYHLDNLALLGYDQVITVSHALLEHCASRGVNPDRLSYVPNGVDLAEFTRIHERNAARTALGLPLDKQIIGVMGRLSPEKGVDRAIRLLASLRRRTEHVQLHLVGDGPQRRELELQAMKLGVANHIHWWGWQTDTQRLYEMMDLLLLPSYTEGLPNVILEAMAMNVPVAATEVGGVSDLLDNGRCGLLLGNDQTAWIKAVATLLGDNERRQELARLAYQRVASQFTIQKRMERISAIYNRMLGVTVNCADEEVRIAA